VISYSQVENHLFRLPQHQLIANCQVLFDMLTSPNQAGVGLTAEKPIKLPPDVAVEDFHSFLEELLPM